MAKVKKSGVPPLMTDPRYKGFVERYSNNLHRFAIEVCGLQLTYQQIEVANSVNPFGSRTTISSGHGCFGVGTKIMMFDGSIKNVENVKQGDRLMGDDGTPRNVLLLCRGEENLYKFTYSDGTSHVFNESHILCLVATNSKGKRKTGDKVYPTVAEYLTWGKDKKHSYKCYRAKSEDINNKYLLPIKSVESLGKGKYYGFELDGNHKFLGGDFTVLHNTGKTALFGVIALWHMLCFYNSITAIVAPNVMQVRKQVFKEVNLSLQRMKKTKFDWVAEQVEPLETEIYVKGAKAYWHILAKTAPKNAPENLAGLHGDFLLVIVDEASGVEDTHFGVLTGALTDNRNRMVLASQPTRNVGFFYDTHHTLSIPYGGTWNNITLNSELSPIVSKTFLIEKKLQYSREQYAIKVRGEFPNKSDGFLVGRSEVDSCFGFNPISESDDYGYVLPVDVGGGDFRDSSVMTVAWVYGFGMYGKDARRVYIDEIPVVDNSENTVNSAKRVFRKSCEYESSLLAVDKGGMGTAFIHNLEELGASNLHKVVWGNPCFKKEYKEQFVNLRAQAVVGLARAIKEGRFGISSRVSERYRSRIINELTRIPYHYDSRARYQIMSKADMKAQGIPSPDIADTFAFCFLENVQYIAIEKGQKFSNSIADENKQQLIQEKFSNIDNFFSQ